MSYTDPYGKPMTDSFGIKPTAPPAPTLQQQIGGALLNLVPRVGMGARIINAGPVSDGTLDYARRMGWMR
jgi:hypothetical protein